MTVWNILEGEGFWADYATIRLLIKRDHTGKWESWLLVRSSGGSVYRGRETSLLRAKGDLCIYAEDFLLNTQSLQFERAALLWHPIGPGGRFVLFSVAGEVFLEECNPGGEGDCVRDHNGILLSTHDSKADADSFRKSMSRDHPNLDF
jgi:hypothetical protein